MNSPTQRTLAEMRRRGYLADVTERWIPGAMVRRDLFGFGDVLAVGEREVVMVQATSASNAASRIRKITEHENLGAVRKGGIRILVHAWKKVGSRWQLWEVDLS
jgi:hypothetical protein